MLKEPTGEPRLEAQPSGRGWFETPRIGLQTIFTTLAYSRSNLPKYNCYSYLNKLLGMEDHIRD